MDRPQKTKQQRQKAHTVRNWAKVEQFLTEYEKVHGCAKSWEMRQRLESGEIALSDLLRH